MVLLTILQSGLFKLNFLHFCLPASMLEGAILLTCSKGKKQNKIFDPLGAQIFHLVA